MLSWPKHTNHSHPTYNIFCHTDCIHIHIVSRANQHSGFTFRDANKNDLRQSSEIAEN